jgi:hypothetical protein
MIAMVHLKLKNPRVTFAGPRPAMNCLAPVPRECRHLVSIATARYRFCLSQPGPASSPPRSLPKQFLNAPRQNTASAKIPIASDAQPRHTSRGFLPWRFAYAGPRHAPCHHRGAAIRKPSQKRRFDPEPAASGLPHTTDIVRPARLVRFVQQADNGALCDARL